MTTEQESPSFSKLFHVYKLGRLTLIGFEAQHIDEEETATEVRQQLESIIEAHSCEILVVDLMNVGIVSSWILGVLASVKKTGIDVELYHPSKEIMEVLNVTHLDELLHVRDSWSADDLV